MTRRGFYLFSLWLPLIVPLILYIFGMLFKWLQLWLKFTPPNIEGIIGDILVFILFSTLFGGVQYIIFGITVALWFKYKNARYIGRASWTLPLLFAPICVLGLWLVLGDDRGTWDGYSGILGIAVVFGKFSLIIGYVYVLLAHAFAFIFSRIGFIKD